MKKIISVFLSVMMILSLFSVAVSAKSSSNGDINGDGYLSSWDVYLHRKDNIKLNVNGDNTVDGNDTFLLSYLATAKDDRYPAIDADRIFDDGVQLNGNIDLEIASKFNFENEFSDDKLHITVSVGDMEGLTMTNFMLMVRFDESKLEYSYCDDIFMTDLLGRNVTEDGVLLCSDVFYLSNNNQRYDVMRIDFDIKDGVEKNSIEMPSVTVIEINEGTVASLCDHIGGTATCTKKAICEICGQEYGYTAEHEGGLATCSEKAKCEICGQQYGQYVAHKEQNFDDLCDVCGKQLAMQTDGVQLIVIEMDGYLYVMTAAYILEEYDYVSVYYKYNKFNLDLVSDGPDYNDVQITLGEELNGVVDGFYIIDEQIFTILNENYALPEIIKADAIVNENSNESEVVYFTVYETLYIDANHTHVDENSDSICDFCSKISDSAFNHDHVDDDYSCSCDICGFPVYYWGDMNCDGNITAADARSALRMSAQIEETTPYALYVGDFNEDGKLTAAEARKILRVSAGLDTF